MDKITKIILSAGLVAQMANGAESEEDKKIKEIMEKEEEKWTPNDYAGS